MSNITDLTFGEILQMAAMVDSIDQPQAPAVEDYYEIGKYYLIRTDTMYQVGRLIAVNKNEYVLDDAAWVAYTGMFYKCLIEAKFENVQPVLPASRLCIVSRGAMRDMFPIHYTRPESLSPDRNSWASNEQHAEWQAIAISGNGVTSANKGKEKGKQS